MNEIDKKVLDKLFGGKQENYEEQSKKALADAVSWESLTAQPNDQYAHIQQVLEEAFNGDIDAYNAHIADSNRKKLNWQDIIIYEETLCDYRAQGPVAIVTLLGYVPPLPVTIKYEPFIRALALQQSAGHINDEEYFDQCEELVKQIRNLEVGHHDCLEYDQEIMHYYETYLPHLKEIVQTRLKKFLGYEPKAEHSAGVEILLRKEMAADSYWKDEKPKESDYYAINIIKYREILLKKGKNAADASPLHAQDINYRYK